MFLFNNRIVALAVKVKMSSRIEISSLKINFHKLEEKLIPLDIFTAAHLGDIAYFMKYDVRDLPSKLAMSNSSDWTPLMYACARGHTNLVNYLLTTGAKRSCKSKSGVTPLMLAVFSGDLPCVESVYDLTELEKTDYHKWTPLFYAIHYTREKCLNFLLSKGANVNIVDYQNETPLIAAIKAGREAFVELIIKTAKNLDVVSYKNESALMLANESKNPKIQYLVNKHYETLKKSESGSLRTTPVKFEPEQRSPTPIKNQLKKQVSQIKTSKSFSYSPNKISSPKSPKINLFASPKFLLPKKLFWSPQPSPYYDVEQFLISLGLEKYWPIFRDEEVDFETLLTLNENNLKELGIDLFGPRKKILLAIQKLRKKF